MSNKDSDLQGVLPKEWSFSERLALLFSPNKFQEAMEGYMEVANDKYNNGVIIYILIYIIVSSNIII